MRFQEFIPSVRLQPYVQRFIISENVATHEYKVFPSTNIVIGFQYAGSLTQIKNGVEYNLSSPGITGLLDTFRIFKNSPNIGSVLVYFTEVGFAAFTKCPAHDIVNLSISLDYLFNKGSINETQERLCYTVSDKQKIDIVENFLISQLKAKQQDLLMMEAVRKIKESRGTIRIRELQQSLCISASPFEKRFRKAIGISPKKFASIVRFNTVLQNLPGNNLLTDITYHNNFFDQSHFIKDFKQFTGTTPKNFKVQLPSIIKNDFLQL